MEDTATNGEPIRAVYERSAERIRREFEVDGDGPRAIAERSALLDDVLRTLWSTETASEPGLAQGIAIVGVGGYGRAQLFPYSDADLLFCLAKGDAERAKEPIRKVSQALWDCGVRASPFTRNVSECERFAAENAEFGLSLLDRRFVAGDASVFAKLHEKIAGKLIAKDAKAIRAELLGLTRARHAKYGTTIFHLEPNIKDCPGGLRDAHVVGWSRLLQGAHAVPDDSEFRDAVSFLSSVRCFLHFRHERDDNTLDWQAQDVAAERGIGLHARKQKMPDAAAWMRSYFRHARVIARCLERTFEGNGMTLSAAKPKKRIKIAATTGFQLKDGNVVLNAASADVDPAAEPDIVLRAFEAVAKTGARLDSTSDERIADALPKLSANLEEGPALWQRLAAILVGEYAGTALRMMHAIGVLELLLPEFHGIDALVIRDAYHRYTVDEHTFVLIDTLHGLEAELERGAPDWRVKFGAMVRELQSPELLYLAALLHDTGKGRMGESHAIESSRIAQAVLERLEMDPYDTSLVLRLIETHLEMSATLRRDIFDAETVHVFAAKIQTHELLRMLTLFTYADIQAVHPDALTPWKAENLWRLSMSTSNQLDRNVDEERVHARDSDKNVAEIVALLPGRKAEAQLFLEGFPERYLKTRSRETVIQHFEMSMRLEEEPFQLLLQTGAAANEITLVTRDRPALFSAIAGALAGWGMNVITADAFANASGVVVDSFRFTDTFRTLELNASERERFLASVRELVAGRKSVENLLSGRRGRKKRALRLVVETRIEFDVTASTHSTLMQVVAQDVPGLLRAISETLSRLQYNVEVALVDTEGETAIDVFYLTQNGKTLHEGQQVQLRSALQQAIEANAV